MNDAGADAVASQVKSPSDGLASIAVRKKKRKSKGRTTKPA